MDLTIPNQSIAFVGLHQMLLQYPRVQFIEALNNMDGVHTKDSEIQIPTKHFK
jgi:hypothetical protein